MTKAAQSLSSIVLPGMAGIGHTFKASAAAKTELQNILIQVLVDREVRGGTLFRLKVRPRLRLLLVHQPRLGAPP
jgi:hypothetical protein